jgi:hypothetical protein
MTAMTARALLVIAVIANGYCNFAEGHIVLCAPLVGGFGSELGRADVIDFSVGNWPAMTRRSKDRWCPDGLQWTSDQPPSTG